MLPVTQFPQDCKMDSYGFTSGSIVRITEISQGIEISVSSRVARIMCKQHKLFTVVG